MTTRVAEAGPNTPNLSDLVAPQLPYLRRFARALCGEQRTGDAFVAAVLEALIADRSVLDLSLPPRVALYALFHRIWSSAQPDDALSDGMGGALSPARLKIARLTPRSRQMLLLTTLEGFTLEDASEVMGIAAEEGEILASDARAELDRQMRARVMIIEDEPIIALDIESIVAGMGHEVCGIADTHDSAVALAGETSPELVLADIQLADGSSGIEAVEDILARMDVPVIFITAYPERLLTGERPEPTFLVTKPFKTETVEAAISQVLFLRGASAKA